MDFDLDRTAKLIAEARAGRREASDELFRAYGEVLGRAIRRRMHGARSPRFDTSDVVQEALADAVLHFDDFEPRGPGSFRRWLLAILENRLRMAVHREHAEKRDARREAAPARGRSGSFPSALAGSVTSPSSAAAAGEERERVELLLARLSPDHAEVVRLVKIRELSVAEAARRMGRTENAVKKLLARALLAMRAELGRSP